jgi:hypothetical protein
MKNDKSFVLDKLHEAMIKEELAIPLYVSHIEQTLFWSGLPVKKQEKIIDGLKILAKESEIHSIYLKKIIDIYKQ